MALHKLSATGVEKKRKPGHHSDGGNLYLQVSKARTKSWVFRYRKPGRAKDEGIKIREMGLGPYPEITLDDAREMALANRRLLLKGIDPIEARDDEVTQKRLAEARTVTFRECADKYIAAHQGGWSNAKHKYQWRQTLGIACNTSASAGLLFGDLAVADVDTGLVLKVLEPIWAKKPETASRLRQRIEKVLNWAASRTYRQGENPARWKGHLENLR